MILTILLNCLLVCVVALVSHDSKIIAFSLKVFAINNGNMRLHDVVKITCTWSRENIDLARRSGVFLHDFSF